MEAHYAWLITALLYAVLLAWAASHTERYLPAPTARIRMHCRDARVCSGDVLLWSSAPSWATDVEKLLCGSAYNHVGMVFVDAAGQAYVWDCTRHGHRVRSLWVTVQKGSVMWRRLSRPVDSAALERFILANLAQPYSFNLWQGVVTRWASWLHLPHSRPRTAVHSRFCSQLVAETYAALGILDFSTSHVSPHLLMPGDFASCRPGVLPWARGYSLSGEVELVGRG